MSSLSSVLSNLRIIRAQGNYHKKWFRNWVREVCWVRKSRTFLSQFISWILWVCIRNLIAGTDWRCSLSCISCRGCIQILNRAKKTMFSSVADHQQTKNYSISLINSNRCLDSFRRRMISELNTSLFALRYSEFIREARIIEMPIAFSLDWTRKSQITLWSFPNLEDSVLK